MKAAIVKNNSTIEIQDFDSLIRWYCVLCTGSTKETKGTTSNTIHNTQYHLLDYQKLEFQINVDMVRIRFEQNP